MFLTGDMWFLKLTLYKAVSAVNDGGVQGRSYLDTSLVSKLVNNHDEILFSCTRSLSR